MGIEDVLSVEMVERQIEIVTLQGVGIYGDGGFRFLTPAQRELVYDLAALDLDAFVYNPI